jgi:SHS2 domain-containing protein
VSFEIVDHTADTAARLRSPDERELFRDATRALASILLDEAAGAPAAPRMAVAIRLEAESPEALLIDYLNELIFRFDAERFLPAELDPSRVVLGKPACLEATLRGEPYDSTRHRAKTEIKAATFHDLEIRRTPAGFEADVVFDL